MTYTYGTLGLHDRISLGLQARDGHCVLFRNIELETLRLVCIKSYSIGRDSPNPLKSPDPPLCTCIT